MLAESSAFPPSIATSYEESPVNRLLKRAKRVLRSLKDSIIQPCPPELYACEVCDERECDDEKWQTCEHRLKVAAQVRAAEAELKNFGNSTAERAPAEVDSSPADDNSLTNSSEM